MTARHVVENTPDSEELYIRVNTLTGKPLDVPAPAASWKKHPVTDVAAIPMNWPEPKTLDAMTIPFTKLPRDKPQVTANRITEGDEILIVGLLTHFPGSKRIQPIVRSGRIALMPHKKIPVEVSRDKVEDVDAYLIEAMSWPGLSGSPIIIYPNRNPANPHSFDYMLEYLVLGLLHGPVELEKDVVFIRDTATIRLGSGIAVAIPGEASCELLTDHPELRVHRAELLDQRKRGLST